ncbi:hypothetical protein PFLUV_G00051150 [Perca fluviatilis]|uniref:Ig-like domain-containing protein n=1 Tax=Perca fluviatilis TaxID=8168 RepID=A0A6A5FDQ7_PERFL|nr:hypothetical protein PFLUV_G00051150 [Perca fluviatilis]
MLKFDFNKKSPAMELLPLLCLCLLTRSGITSADENDPFLKDQSGRNIPGAAQEPYITSLNETKDWRLLQCEVHGNPKPEVEWQDSAGTKLPAEESQVTEKNGLFYITLNVTKSDRYRCVATQTIHHQIYAETDVHISVPISADSSGPQTHPSDQNLRKVMIGVAVGVLAEFLFL